MTLASILLLVLVAILATFLILEVRKTNKLRKQLEDERSNRRSLQDKLQDAQIENRKLAQEAAKLTPKPKKNVFDTLLEEGSARIAEPMRNFAARPAARSIPQARTYGGYRPSAPSAPSHNDNSGFVNGLLMGALGAELLDGGRNDSSPAPDTSSSTDTSSSGSFDSGSSGSFDSGSSSSSYDSGSSSSYDSGSSSSYDSGSSFGGGDSGSF